MHKLQVIGWLWNQRGRNFQGTLLCAEILSCGIDRNDFLAALSGLCQIAVEAIKMTLINNGSVLGVVQQFRIHFGHCFLRCRDDLVQFFLGHQQVVRCETNLAGIQRLAHHDAPEAFLNISTAGNHHR